MIQPSDFGVILRYYPDTPVTCYPYSCPTRDFSHLLPDERQQRERGGLPMAWAGGTMEWDRYERLKSSIQEEGVLNPFIVQWFTKPKPDWPKGYKMPTLAIHVGNNRACVMNELGMERGPVLFAVPRSVERLLPEDPYVSVGINSSLLSTLRSLWRELLRAPDENHDGNLGVPDAWMDSNLLLELVRSTLDNPNSLKRQRSARDETGN